MTELTAIKADITTLRVDAIVNAANSSLMGGGGVDGAIHRAGGPTILEQCRAIVARQGGCATGDAVVTTGGDLLVRFVIHTVGPVWTGDDPDQHDRLLASCYRSSLVLAAEHDLTTIAFPGISTGVYGFPKPRAAEIAVAAVRSWLDAETHELDQVTFVCFDDESLDLYRELLTEMSPGQQQSDSDT